MSYLFSGLGKRVKRSLSQYLQSWLKGEESEYGTKSNSGVLVTELAAIQDAAVMSCVRVLGESLAQLPFNVYQRDGRNVSPVRYHPLHEVLHNQPNPNMHSFTWRELGQAHLCLRGSTYAFKEIDNKGNVIGLHPLNPDRLTPFSYTQDNRISYEEIMPGAKIAYKYRDEKGIEQVLLKSELLAINGLSLNGLYGLNPIAYQRESIGLSLAAKKYGAKLFENGAHVGGVISVAEKLDDEAYKRMKKSWQENYAGLNNAHKPAILEQGAKFERMGMSSKDAQWLEMRKYQRSEIAGIYRVPLHMINDLERATFSNVEHLSTDFVTYSMSPWCKRWEQSANMDLLTLRDRQQGIFVEFSLQGLLRGDTTARSNFYQSGIQAGWLTRNEAREKENLNPMEGGDELLQPLNMQTVAQMKTEEGNEKQTNDESVVEDV